jgi:hypothetical protein
MELKRFALKPKPINFFKVLLRNTLKKFIGLGLIGNCCESITISLSAIYLEQA